MSIYMQVLAFIRRPDPGGFEALAMQVFRHQFETVSPYRNYCLDLGVSPASVESLEAVPPVSTIAFKYAKLTGAPAERVFMTSGTSAGQSERGRHFIAQLEVYRASALGHAARMLFPDGRRMRMLALHPSAEEMPYSSLAQMLTWLVGEFGSGPILYAATTREIDLAAALEFLRLAERERAAICILATTAALGALFTKLRQGGVRLRMARGSRLMDTGGAKGQERPLPAQEVAALAAQTLAIDPPLVINEYGMTEMCSQLYDATAFNSWRDEPPEQRVKLAPPWLRARAVDPLTLAPLGQRQVGLLSYFDLANVGSVSALLSEDLGAVEGGAVRIIGRAEAGETRGCALGIEQFALRDAGRRAGARQ